MKCKCGEDAEIIAYSIIEFHPDSGRPFQEIKCYYYNCVKCGEFSDEIKFTENGTLKNMRVHLI